ncbi:MULTISPECIES: aspartate/glutamate racemase family protein [unclassified Achromobacter]|uniref:aspartate/glutamate racemase family protein n=1 Tax=unclassified Achromobacter TaxID=2626865 RepID=UPI000B51D597|nr:MULTISPECIES: aspartate/glutamate racemase family protein [unclassified Achromobacter]OWT72893.1 hypothetical protein CEY05_23675 [Achromobacter sp. HZ34]OWT74111.1 hypothetical protein CEY04_22510 [Achromobacter sp. HZ28]
MRLLVLNPNTSEAVSGRLRMVLSSGLMPGEQLRVETAASGLAYIGDVAAMAVGAQAARASLQGVMAERVAPGDGRAAGAGLGDGPAAADHATDECFDAVLLACFADLDTAGLQALAGRPAVSLLGASVRMAARAGRRWAVVTGGAGWQQLLPEMFAVAAASQAVAGELVCVRTFEVQDPAIAGDPLRMQAEIARLARLCADEDGADVVIIGGAGLGGLAPAGAVGRRDVLVLDSVLCGLQVARESINPAPLRATRSGSGPGPAAVTVAVVPGNHNHD